MINRIHRQTPTSSKIGKLQKLFLTFLFVFSDCERFALYYLHNLFPSSFTNSLVFYGLGSGSGPKAQKHAL